MTEAHIDAGALSAHFAALHARLDVIDQRATISRHHWLRHVIKDLETNPKTQYKVHFWGVVYWLINFPLVAYLFFGLPLIWLKWGIFITLVYSIYANFATDYGSMSAALAAQGRDPLPVIPMDVLGTSRHYQQQEEVHQLAMEIKRGTDLLEEIHRHVTVLSPHAGKFDPDGSETAPGPGQGAAPS
jgi:hypothetical protein